MRATHLMRRTNASTRLQRRTAFGLAGGGKPLLGRGIALRKLWISAATRANCECSPVFRGGGEAAALYLTSGWEVLGSSGSVGERQFRRPTINNELSATIFG